MDQITMENKIVRYGSLKPCKTTFIDAHTPGSDQKKILLFLVEVYLKAPINIYTLMKKLVSTLEQQVNLQNVEIVYIHIVQQRFFLF